MDAEAAPEPTWYLYLLECCNGRLYTGIATDVARRVAEHQSQGPKSAKYTRGKLPLTLVYQQEIGNRSAASKEELRIKSLTRKQKQALIAGSGQGR